MPEGIGNDEALAELRARAAARKSQPKKERKRPIVSSSAPNRMVEGMGKARESRISKLEAEVEHHIPLSEITLPKIRNRAVHLLNTTNPKFLSLVEAIRAFGQKQAVLVRPIDHPKFKYEIVYGRRRFTALNHLGEETILAKVRVLSDQEASRESFLENEERAELSIYELGLTWADELAEGVYASGAELARNYNVTPPTVTQRIKVAEYPNELIEAIKDPTVLKARDISAFNKFIKDYSNHEQLINFAHEAIEAWKTNDIKSAAQAVTYILARVMGKTKVNWKPIELTSSGEAVGTVQQSSSKSGYRLQIDLNNHNDELVDKILQLLDNV